MKVAFPPINGVDQSIETDSPIVLIGSNGSGKTRLSVWVERNNPELNIHRISAQKSLALPNGVQSGDLETIREAFYYGRSYDDKNYLRRSMKWNGNGRWGKNPAVHELNDFEHLLKLLVTDESDKSIEFRKRQLEGEAGFTNTTIFDQLRMIWNEIIPGKRLDLVSGKVLVTTENNEQYNGSSMSDGEREAFYFIAEALCVPSGSLIIIDEPENHMHEAILSRLWDAIERVRPDCVFMYATHKLSFATSRHCASIVWVKGMPSRNAWDYCMLPNDVDDDDGERRIPDELLLEIMGSRQDVVLVEGNGSGSWDRALYQQLFPGKNVIDVGGCNQVVESVKALRRLEMLTSHVNVSGIVDRDCRDDNEVSALRSHGIAVLGVAEIENVFLLPCAIEAVIARLGLHEQRGSILDEVKNNVLEYLKSKVDEQALLRVKYSVRNELNQISGAKTVEIYEYFDAVKQGIEAIDVEALARPFRERCSAILQSRDYEAALQVLNCKGVYQVSGLKRLLGLDRQGYMRLIISILADKTNAERMQEAKALAEGLRAAIEFDVQ